MEVYRFLRDEGSGHMQFIPIVERRGTACGSEDLELVLPSSPIKANVTPWSVRPDEFGEFLCAIFDEWVRHDVGRVFVQTFEVSLMAWMGLEPNLCIFQKECGLGLALEHTGDLYSCDHFVYPEHQLGNIMETQLGEMVYSEKQRQFGKDKLETLPQYCLDCDVRFICNGDCPKHRFINTPDGEPGLSYLCSGYKRFFHHIDPYMKFMVNELRARSTTNVMAWVRQRDYARRATGPGPNDPCLCGSNRKYKKCCGRWGTASRAAASSVAQALTSPSVRGSCPKRKDEMDPDRRRSTGVARSSLRGGARANVARGSSKFSEQPRLVLTFSEGPSTRLKPNHLSCTAESARLIV